MPYENEIKKKTISVDDAVNLVKSGMNIYAGAITAEPFSFLENLHVIADRGVRGVRLTNMQSLRSYDFFEDARFEGVIQTDVLFSSALMRPSYGDILASYVPNHLRTAGHDRVDMLKERGEKLDIYVVGVSPPDRHGFFSSGSWCDYHRTFAENADIIVAEVNENCPRTLGDTYLHISEVDFVTWGDNQIYYPEPKPSDEAETAIAGHIAELIEDEATLQIGIGGIPNAIAAALEGKKDLGVHTEMLGDGTVELLKNGIATNRKKTLHPNKTVAAFSYGSKALYEWIDDNPGVLHLDVAYVNDPHTISRNRKMTSINTALQIDLMGQCASEAIGTLQLSGTGGQMDTAVGAREADGGKSIIALKSTAMIRTGSGGERERRSTIVPIHPEGTVVTLTRAAVDFVATEYGLAALRGVSLKERAKALIRIAHPDYRDMLAEESEKHLFARRRELGM